MGLPFKLLLSADTKFITVDGIPALTANAMYPKPENDGEFVVSKINHEAALHKAIKAGMVTPLNPLSYEQHTFPFGDALQKAVISLADLKRFAETLQIEVVIWDEPVPTQDDVVSTKTHLTIREAASALAEKYGFNENTTKTMRTQLMDAAKSGDLTVRHPHTLLPYRPDTIRDFYELVSLSDLNAWLETQGVEYQLPIAEQEQYRASDEYCKGTTQLADAPTTKEEAGTDTNGNIHNNTGARRINETQAFLMDCIKQGIPVNIHSIWLHMKANAGKDGFLFRGVSNSTATTINDKQVEKKNMARTLRNLLKAS